MTTTSSEGEQKALPEGISYATWPDASPPLFADHIMTVICGNTRCHFCIHEDYQIDFHPLCYWKTGPIDVFEEGGTQSREEWMATWLPPKAFEIIFGTNKGPTAVEIAAMFATRKVSMFPVYVISTNDEWLPNLIHLLRCLPTQIVMIRAQDFGRNAYPGVGVDRLAALVGAEHEHGSPTLVIDGGTAMTWTCSDIKHNLRGGGIAPGLAMKFKALHEFTGRLPDIDYQQVMDRLQEKKPVALFARDTHEALITGVLRETTTLLAHIIRVWTKEASAARDSESGKKKSHAPIVFTGGDAEVYKQLLSKDRGQILQKADKDGMGIPSEAEIFLNKHIHHTGLLALLMTKTVAKINMTPEELGRSNCIGQRVILQKGSELLRGSIVGVARSQAVKDDMFSVCCEDYSTATLDVKQICAALDLYAEKGESEEVELRIAAIQVDSKVAKGSFLLPKTKKGRSKRAAEWLEALVAGKPYITEDDDHAKLAQKRVLNALEGKLPKKARTGPEPLPVTKDSIVQNPEGYVKRRVAKMFDDDLYFGQIKKYVPKKLAGDNAPTQLWKVVYDDGDQEEYDVDDMLEYIGAYEKHRDEDSAIQGK